MMTTVAWDGNSVAADSQKTMNREERRPGWFEKIVRRGDVVYAATGCAALFEPLIAWYEGGAVPDHMPKDGEARSSGLLVFKDGKCFCFATDLPYPEELFAPDAWGSGACYAIGALNAGKSAADAVEIAAKSCVFTGGPTRVIDLRFQTGAKVIELNPAEPDLKRLVPRWA